MVASLNDSLSWLTQVYSEALIIECDRFWQHNVECMMSQVDLTWMINEVSDGAHLSHNAERHVRLVLALQKRLGRRVGPA